MEDAIRLYRTLLGNRAYVRSVSEGTAFFAASAIAIFASVTYATVHASNYVTDFVLSRVGPYNLRFLFVYGTFAAFVVTAGLLAWRPNRLPFALKATALFLLVRAVFVALTHMAPSPIDPQKAAPFFNSRALATSRAKRTASVMGRSLSRNNRCRSDSPSTYGIT